VSNARSVCNLPPTASRESVASKARTTGRAFLMYTSTIGASLPVIDTLGNIMRTGDRVLRIETALSGSMGFVTNQVMRGVPLSEAVREALARGYCESDPREDLAGTDVAAKIVVLARALGVRLDRRLIKVEPLVPHEVLSGLRWSGVEGDADSLCEALKAHDDAFRSEFYAPAIEQGKRLHYVASIDLSRFPAIQAEVKPALIDESHPAFYARDNEISFGFSTQQYQVFGRCICC
jgi:aspartokinase/homoserine dehydrogenase 1